LPVSVITAGGSHFFYLPGYEVRTFSICLINSASRGMRVLASLRALFTPFTLQNHKKQPVVG
jgi:hypothetical protein